MTNTYSLNKCPMEMQAEMPDGESCTPGSVNHINTISITNNCCSVKIVDPSLKAKFLSSNQNLSTNFTLHFLAVNTIFILLNESNLIEKNDKTFFDSSPPLHSSNSLYITNSTLLI